MKIISFSVIAISLFVMVSCELPVPSEPGEISVSLTGLQSLTNFDADSDLLIEVWTGNYPNESLVGEYEYDNVNSNSLLVTLGSPPVEFEGGDYYLDVLIDIDDNDSYYDSYIDYWLIYFEEVEVNGDVTVSVDEMDFELF